MNKDLIFASIAFVAIGVVCFGLAAARPPVTVQPSAPLESKRVIGKNDRVIMHVNGEPITENEFSVFVGQAPEQMQFFYNSPEGRRLLADEMAKLKALEQEGRRLGVQNDPQISTRLAVNETNVIAGSALRKIIGTPSEQRLRAEYAKQRGSFESAQLSHILIAFQGGAVPPRSGKALSDAEAKQKAERLRARIVGGADFAAVASAESDDMQSAPNGGSLGVVQPGSLPPDLQKVVSALEPGQVSAPVRSEFGYHIFRAGERRAQPFEAVRDALAARIQRDEAAAAMDRLYKAAKIELDEKFFGREKKAPQQRPGT